MGAQSRSGDRKTLRRRDTEHAPPNEATGSFLNLAEKAHLPVGSKRRVPMPSEFPLNPRG